MCLLQNLYWNLIPKGFGGRAFRRWLGHEGGPLMNQFSTLIKETLETFVTPSPTEEHSREMAIYKPESRSSLDTEPSGVLILGFLASRTIK